MHRLVVSFSWKGFMKKIILFLMLFSPVVSFADAISSISSFEEKHKDASYIFLLYSNDVKVNEDWSYVTHTHKIVKVQKEDAKDMGEVPIAYLKGSQKISDIKVFTVTPDGRKYRYTKIQDFNLNDGNLMYSDQMLKTITLPQVNIGSLLDSEYTIRSKGLPMKGAYWDTFGIDAGISTKKFKFSLTVPKKLNIKYKSFGLSENPKITETKTSITYLWEVDNVDASSGQEDYTPPPTPENYKNSIDISSIPAWSDVSNWYMYLIKKNIKLTPEIISLVQQLIKGKQGIKEKVRAIKEYLQDNFRYVSMSFGNNAMEPHPTDEVFANKYGDCKDMSLLTMAMLKVAGVDSSIALFKKEFEINDPKFDLPIPSIFDHVLLLIKDKKEGDFYLDPLLKDYDIGEYPLEYQRAYTFIINENGGKMDQFPEFNEERNHTIKTQDITIEADGTDTVIADNLSDLDSSIENRNQIKAMDKESRSKFFESLDNTVAGNGRVISRKIEGLDQKYGPLRYHSVVKRKDDYFLTDDIMIIDVTAVDKIFDFTSKERENPIFNPVNCLDQQKIVYHVPQGFDIYYIPKNIDLNIGFFSIKRHYSHKNNVIKLTQVVRLKIGKYPVADYIKIKNFFDKLTGRTQQRIVLRKRA